MSLESSETSVPNRRRTRKRTVSATDAAVEQTLDQETSSSSSAKPAAASKSSHTLPLAAEESSEAVKPRASRRIRVPKPSRDEDFGESLDIHQERPAMTHEDHAGDSEEKPPAKARRRAPRQEELDLSFDDIEEAPSSQPPARPEARRDAGAGQASSYRKDDYRQDSYRKDDYRREESVSERGGRSQEDASFDEQPKSADQQEFRSRGHFQRRRDRQGGDRPGGDRPVSDRPVGDRQGGDRSVGDRQGGDRGGQNFAGNGGGRQRGFRYRDRGGDRGADRQGGERQGNDRQGGDRQGSDRQGGERFQSDRGYRQRGGYQNRPGGNQGGHQGGGGQQGNFQKSRKQPAKANYTARASNTIQPVVEINGPFTGVLELHPKGYGFLRDPAVDYGSQEHDPFVSSSLVEKHKLREGVMITGHVGPGSRNQGPRLHEIFTIDNREVEEYELLKHFDELTAINPFEQIKLETAPTPITMRVMDLLTPIGKGQRALIVAPPRTGKTMLLQDIANSVSTNHPEVHLIVLLIDERPEEVTEMRRLVRGEVIASSMDRDVESHVRTSQLIIERGKRIAEAGGDAFILLDSITRTARAFNKWVGNTGRTMTGGLDVKAMDIPKKMFGQARRFDEGGSLTIVGTALINTGSQMDEVIFQEFKGTGNMEMVLSRELADRRIWPAIDVSKSGTRREEKILDRETLEGITLLRRSLVSLNPVEAMEQLTATLNRFPSNKEFLQKIKAIL